jgi:hypothetical protein
MVAVTYSYTTPQYREKVINRWQRVIVSVSMLAKALRVLLPRMFTSYRIFFNDFLNIHLIVTS